MADDAKIPKFEDTEPLFEDTVPLDNNEEELSSPKIISKGESFLKGAEQGATAGSADEIQGAIPTGLDKVQSLLHSLGLASPSPTDVNSELAAKGFTGDLGPQSSGDLYREERDASRKKYDEAAAANPTTSLAGNIAGGLLTVPLLPEGIVGAAGSAPAGANLGTRALYSAANAARPAAIAGLGTSNADLTRGDIGGAIEDTANGMTLGMGLGAAMPVAGDSLKSAGKALSGSKDKVSDLLSKIVPENLRNAYARGKAGINTSSDDFYTQTNKAQNALAEEVGSPINQQVKNQTDLQNAKVADLEGKLASSEMVNAQKAAESQAKAEAAHMAEQAKIQAQIDEMNAAAKRAVELGEKRQTALNANEVQNANKETVKVAQNLQKRVYDVKQALGKQFDEIEAAAEKTGVVPDTQGIIEGVQNTLAQKSALTPQQIEGITKHLGSASDPGGYQGFKNVKQALADLFDHADPTVRSATKQAYSALKNQYANDLKANGFDALANRMNETNGRWGAAMELEDKFLSNLRPDRFTGKVQASPDTIRAVGQFGEKNPVQMAQVDDLTGLLTKLDPEGAGQQIRNMQGAADQTAMAKALPKDVPQLPNPELTRLEALLQQVKANKPQASAIPELPNSGTSQLQNQLAQVKAQDPTQIQNLPLNTQNPEALNNDLLKLLPKAGMKSGDIQAENKLDNIMKFLKAQKGEDYVNDLQGRLKTVNQDIKLRDAGQPTADVPTGMQQVAAKIAGGATGIANKAGLAVKKANEKFLQVGIGKLSNATPEQLDEVAMNLSQKGPMGQQYAKVLQSTKGKNVQSRNAIIFGLMQQPDFRALFHDANGTHDNEESGK